MTEVCFDCSNHGNDFLFNALKYAVNVLATV